MIVKSQVEGKHYSRQAGMTLIEVLVALILISVGLLGVAALQLATLKHNQEAYVRSQASVLAAYILDRIRANQQNFQSGAYDVAPNGTGTGGTVAGNDLAAWQAEINRLLPGGSLPAGSDDAAGQIQRTSNVATVTIRWSERADVALSTDVTLNETAGTRTLQIRTEI